ncbi:MAG TPA: outer membrane protein transport protein [Candidatus Paceibacterota bacterium]|nr:outer membrane protein transport protein [Verrucomicrobiota bacterium]HSA10412.1 outer membrane protein transport protein [Candidatus Paceibacterota bacterium]
MITNRRRTACVLLAVAAGLSGPSALANGFRLAGQDAFATGRGEAFVATADNASAVYYNPAGLAQLDGSNLRAGGYGIYLDPTFRPPGGRSNSGTTYSVDDHYAVVPQLFYAYAPEDFPLCFGFGAYAPYGGDLSWPQDTGFRTVATKGSLTYLRMNPVVALRLGDKLSVAGGLMVDYADIEMEGGLRRRINPIFPEDFFRFQGNGWSVGYNVGLLWRPHEKVALGATFRSSTPVTFEGDTDFERPTSTPPTHRSAEMDLDFPLGAVVGVSFRPTAKWNLEFDVDYTDWSSYGRTTIHQPGAPDGQESVVPRDVDLTFDWQESWMFGFGVTRYFDNGWHVSAGYLYSQNSVPDDYYSPLAADLDRHFFSVGAGFRGKRFSFDVAYQFGYGPDHTVNGSAPSSLAGVINGQDADGTYDFISHAVFLTVGMRF